MKVKHNKNLTLMADIMKGIYQSDEWQDILTHDPRITTADARYSAALEKAKDWLPKALYMELSDAHTDEITDAGEVGVLFGIRVADVIRDVSFRPVDLSRHILKQTENNRTQYNLEDVVRRLERILRDLQTEIDIFACFAPQEGARREAGQG